MQTVTLSKSGRILIPSAIRKSYNWRPGTRLTLTATPNGLLLKPPVWYPDITLDQVFGCLNYDGPAKTIAEMDEAVAIGQKKQWRKESQACFSPR